jgi:hypothetical protein
LKDKLQKYKAVKVIFDKLKDNENYLISTKEIKKLFEIIPNLSKGIKIVHIQNQEPHKSRFPRPVRFEFLNSQLNISAKKLSKEVIVKEILIELISQRGDDITLRPSSYRFLTKNQIRRIENIAKPIIIEYNK